MIPHDRGHRRSFNMSDMHVWAVVGLVVVLCGVSGFLYNRSQVYRAKTNALNAQTVRLEADLKNRVLPENLESHLSEKEGEIRAHYEERDRTMASELSRLYDLEREVRIVSGLPAQGSNEQDSTTSGQGGPPDDPDAGEVFPDVVGMNPPALIMGLENPSADLILAEIRLRRQSLGRYIGEFKSLQHRQAHLPSIWPTDDERRSVRSPFGRRRDPITNQWRSHSGIDIRATYGTSVLATAGGVVIFSGYHQYLGHCVKLDHGYGMQTWYGHMSKRLVEKGDTVSRGDALGNVGSSGRSTGPHIHYEVHVADKRVNPRNYIGQ